MFLFLFDIFLEPEHLLLMTSVIISIFNLLEHLQLELKPETGQTVFMFHGEFEALSEFIYVEVDEKFTKHSYH